MRRILLILSVLLPLRAAADPAPDRVRRTSDALVVDAVSLMGEGKLEQASSLLDRADDIDGRNDAVKYYKGYICIARNDAAGALENFRAAYLLDTTNYWYKSKLSYLYLVSGRRREAMKIYKSMLKDRPYDAEVLSRVSDLYMDEGEYDKADSLLGVIDMVQGENEFTEISRIEILRQKGRFKEFFSRLNSYLATSERTGADKSDLLSKMIGGNDPRFNYAHLDEITALVRTCLDTHPTDTAVAHFAISFFYSTRMTDDLFAVCNSFPEDYFAATAGYSACMQKEDYEKALEYCDRMESLPDSADPLKQAEIHAWRGDCYQYLGQEGKACREYDHALELNPDNIIVLNNYAYFMACKGKSLSKCLKMSRKVIEKEPENPTYLDTYAYILHRRKKYAEAKVYFKKAIIYGGKQHAEILEHYADTLDALGETVLAEGIRQQAALKRGNGKKK